MQQQFFLNEEGEMETLKLVQKTKTAKNPAKPPKNRRVEIEDDLIDLFPLPRYFQVHFQHMHENAHELKSEMAQLKDYVAKVDEKLERLLALLSPPPEPVL
ncbi:MAG: hypothetical protein NTX38_06755 [Methylobacter sp.]|nr:hypothetical protein [Methylobacter sp.]